MFGLTHCNYFNCVMNGSNHLQESDRRPLHLCPVCLRKLQFSVGFDVVKRYEALAQFDGQAGLEDEAAWLDRRLEKIRHSAAN
jgi:archaemetzincin